VAPSPSGTAPMLTLFSGVRACYVQPAALFAAGALNEALRRSAAHVFVESLAEDFLAEPHSVSPEARVVVGNVPLGAAEGDARPASSVSRLERSVLRLREDDFHHLARVLRLRRGEEVSVSDGAGSWSVCRWDGSTELQPAGCVAYEPRPSPSLTVAFALTKGAHPEWAVQRLTEVGVDRVMLFTSARCVARWPADAASRRLARLREVARQAAMQSRRVWLPALDGPYAFSDLVAQLGKGLAPQSAPKGGAGQVASAVAAAGGAGVALAVPGGRPLTLATPTVLIGPEGGWADHELAAVKSHVSLGPHVLRSETAALAAGVLLVALRSGVLRSPARGPG
jgi:16S rRNA (uracil1498-N3)-methyltransferase